MLYSTQKNRRRRIRASLLAASLATVASLGSHAFGQWVPPGAPAPEAGWAYSFDDEFNGTSLNSDTYINGSNTPSTTWLNMPRWGTAVINGELETYQQANVSVSGGDLHLTIKKNGVYYTSGEVQTQGTDNGVTANAPSPFSQLCGKFEITCKAPAGQGFWPAFWQLPEDLSVGWPPEIDTFELPQCGPGYDPSGTVYNAHVGDIMPPLTTGGPNQGFGGWVTPPNNFNITNMNTYAIEWDANMIKWLINGNTMFTSTNVPHTAMYMIINLAMGGGWTGPVGSGTVVPNELTVDSARVFAALPAAGFNWNTASGGNWTDVSGNGWNNSAFPQAPVDTANFNQSLSASQTVTLNNPVTLVGLNLTDQAGGHGWNISGGSTTITMDSDNSIRPTIIGGTGSHIVNAPIALPWLMDVVVNGTQLTLSGPISGVGSVNKSGGGILVMGGSGVSTYTGGTLISAGTIKAGSATALGPANNVLSVNLGGTFDLNGYTENVGALSGSGTIDNTSANGVLMVGNGDSSSSSNTFSGVIQNTVGTLSLTKVGPGTLTLAGNNTYSGTTAVLNGALLATSSGAFGSAGSMQLGDSSGSSNSVIGGGGSASVSIGRNITVQAGNTGTATLGAVFSNNNFETATFSGTITLGSNVGATPTAHGLTITAGQYTYTAFSGLIQDPPGLVGTGAPVTITGGYGDTISHANTFTGGVILTGGNLKITNTAALGTGTFNIGGGAISGSIINNPMIWSGNFSTISATGNTNLGTGNVALTGSRTLSVSNSSLTVGGVIADSGGTNFGITLNNGQYGGTLTFTGLNTFDGGVTLNPTGGPVTLAIGNLGTTTAASAMGTGTLTAGYVSGNTAQFDNTSSAAGTLATNNKEVWNGNLLFVGTHSLNIGTGTVSLGTSNQSTRTITVNANTLTIAGPISNGTNASIPTINLAKAGNGILTLGGTDSYNGSTNISAGTVDLASGLALQNSTLTSAGITFDTVVPSHAFTLGGLSGNFNLALTDTAAHPVTLSIGNNNTPSSYSGVLNGSGGVIKVGTSTLTLLGADTYPGGTNVSAGTLQLESPSAIASGSALSVSQGASVVETRNSSSRILVTVGTLNNSGLIDLQNNQLLLVNASTGTVSSVFNQLKSGFASGTWAGTSGIISSTAATAPGGLYAVGETPSGSNLLVGYTYYGDTNLNGAVDGSDYSRIDSAFLADRNNSLAATGWNNGDFNYDGVIDGSDYTLIDNAFNSQGAVITTELATVDAMPTAQLSAGGSSAAVPEPSTLALVGIGTLGCLSRRRGRARIEK